MFEDSGFKNSLYSLLGSSSQAGRLFGGPWMYLRPNTSKYLEILISVCLYFIRSHYPSHLLVEPSDNAGNLEVSTVGSCFGCSLIFPTSSLSCSNILKFYVHAWVGKAVHHACIDMT